MQIDKRAMIEFRFRCWQLEFCQPAASANIEIHRFELRRKNSRNSGDFWISSLFSVYNRLPPFRVPVSKKKIRRRFLRIIPTLQIHPESLSRPRGL